MASKASCLDRNNVKCAQKSRKKDTKTNLWKIKKPLSSAGSSTWIQLIAVLSPVCHKYLKSVWVRSEPLPAQPGSCCRPTHRGLFVQPGRAGPWYELTDSFSRSPFHHSAGIHHFPAPTPTSLHCFVWTHRLRAVCPTPTRQRCRRHYVTGVNPAVKTGLLFFFSLNIHAILDV